MFYDFMSVYDFIIAVCLFLSFPNKELIFINMPENHISYVQLINHIVQYMPVKRIYFCVFASRNKKLLLYEIFQSFILFCLCKREFFESVCMYIELHKSRENIAKKLIIFEKKNSLLRTCTVVECFVVSQIKSFLRSMFLFWCLFFLRQRA